MARWRVTGRYASAGYGPWVEGDEVELDDDQAGFVNRDSPGTLEPAGRPAVAEVGEEEPEKDRMVRRPGRPRKAATEPDEGT